MDKDKIVALIPKVADGLATAAKLVGMGEKIPVEQAIETIKAAAALFDGATRDEAGALGKELGELVFDVLSKK
jgi:hypothetical protein